MATFRDFPCARIDIFRSTRPEFFFSKKSQKIKKTRLGLVCVTNEPCMASAQQIKDARGAGTQTAIVSGGRKKIHTTYANGDEMVLAAGRLACEACVG
jgi:hypothetical protein